MTAIPFFFSGKKNLLFDNDPAYRKSYNIFIAFDDTVPVGCTILAYTQQEKLIFFNIFAVSSGGAFEGEFSSGVFEFRYGKTARRIDRFDAVDGWIAFCRQDSC